MSDINDELRGAAEDTRREIRGLENIVGNSRGMLHDIHEPGRDGPDDPGASPFWESDVAHLDAQREFWESDAPRQMGVPKPRRPAAELEQLVADLRADQSQLIRVEFITTRDIKARYGDALERLMRERNEAAYEWSRLHWWQWRKRKRLWRTLYGIGGWRVEPRPLADIPERVARCGRFIKRYREGGC